MWVQLKVSVVLTCNFTFIASYVGQLFVLHIWDVCAGFEVCAVTADS